MYVSRAFSKASVFLAASALALALAASGCKKAAPVPTDSSMTEAVQGRLAGDSALGAPAIQSSVKDGVVTLNGTVGSDAARSLAAVDAAQVPGIRTVVNNLTVEGPVAPPASEAAVPPVEAPPTAAPRERESRKIAGHEPKPAPIVRQEPAAQPSQEARVVPPPPPDRNMAAPVTRQAPPRPSFRNVTVPSGTVLPVRVTQTLDSATSQIGDSFSGVLASDVVVDGAIVLARGAAVTGRVSDVQGAAHYKGNSLLSVQLTGINRHGERLTVTSAPYTLQGKGRGKNTAEKVGGGAALGAILGGIFGGGKGAAIGAAAGGGVGAGANTVTKGEQVQIPSESIVRFQLSSPVPLRVSTGDNSFSGDDNGQPAPALQQRPDNQPPQ